MSLRRRFLFALSAVVSLALAGCKVSTINYFPPHPAQVRVMNLMTDAPAVDMQVNGQVAFTNVAYPTVSGYQNFDNTQTTFGVTLSGSGTPILSFSYPLAGEQPYTVLLYGSTTAPQLTMVAEVGNPPTNGNFSLTVFNASQNTSSIDVYVNPPGTDISTLNPNFTNIIYGSTTFIGQFAPGNWQVQVTPNGSKTVIYDSGGTVQSSGIALTLITYSAGSGTLVNAALLQARGAFTLVPSIFARMKAVNGALNVGPVNQVLNGTLVVNANVDFASASGYAQIPSGAGVVSFEPTSTPGAAIASTNVNVPPASDVSVFVTGLPGAQQAYMLVDQNIPITSGQDRLRFVNASPGANPVNASINGTQLAANVAYPTASGYALTTPGTVTVTFTDAATGAVLASQANVTLTANQTTSFYLIGPPGAQGIIQTQDN